MGWIAKSKGLMLILYRIELIPFCYLHLYGSCRRVKKTNTLCLDNWTISSLGVRVDETRTTNCRAVFLRSCIEGRLHRKAILRNMPEVVQTERSIRG